MEIKTDQVTELLKKQLEKYDNDIDGYWKNNSGYNKPVICEHICLHSSLIDDGYKIYINPQMLYSWRN